MTSLKFKKMSVLLGVSAIALCTLSAEPTISGDGYVQVTTAITGTSSSDVATAPYYWGEVILENEADGATFHMTNGFEYSESSAVAYSLDDMYLRYDAAEDDFGSNFALQFGFDYTSFTGASSYTAGDVLQDDVTDWSNTWNLSLEAPIVSNENGVLMVTPIAVFDMSGSDDEGIGAIANYAFTETEAISEVELSYYYNNTDSESKIGAGVVGNLGLDFGVAGNLNINNTEDFDVSAYVSTTVESIDLSVNLLMVNTDTLYIKPAMAYNVNDTLTVNAYNTTTVDLSDGSAANEAYLYATQYLTDDLYVRPYIYTDFDTYVNLRFRVGTSF